MEETQRKDFGKSCNDVGESILVLIKNPVYVLITLGAILELGNVTAMAAFLPKVIQFQYGQTPQASALISGTCRDLVIATQDKKGGGGGGVS